jgi:hypothetical protein
MIAVRNDRTIRNVGQSVAIGDKHFEVVKEFVYLGSLMTPTNDVSLEIQRRIQTAKRKTEIQVGGWGEQQWPGPEIAQNRQSWKDLLEQALTIYQMNT